MRKRRADNLSTAVVQFRCSPEELALWKAYAEHRQKPFADMIRDGLNAACLSVCLCKPGFPVCPKCTKTANFAAKVFP